MVSHRIQAVQKLCAPLFVDDGTGTLMISPQGVEVKLYASLLMPGVQYQISPGDTIFIVGTLQENPWSRKKTDSESSELSRIGPGFVSEDEADRLWRQASPLLDPNLPAEFPDDAREFDLYPPKILMKGKGLFIISKQSPREALSKLS